MYIVILWLCFILIVSKLHLLPFVAQRAFVLSRTENKNIRCSGAILALLSHLLTLKINAVCPSETSRIVYPTTRRCLSED